MNMVSGYTYGQNIQSGFTGDMITDEQKNLNNWTVTGNVSINYTTENAVVFTNVGDMLAQMRAWRFNTNVITDAEFEEFVTAANAKFGAETWKIYAVWAKYDGHLQCITFGAVPISYSMTYEQKISDWGNANGWKKDNTTDTYSCLVWRREWVADQQPSSSSHWEKSALIDQKIFNTNYYSGYGISYDSLSAQGFNGSITDNITVEDNKKYLFSFKLSSASTFSVSGDNIVLTSGNNRSVITIDGSGVEKTYEGKIISDGTSINIRYNLFSITSSSAITLIIKEISMYQLQ